MKKIFAPIDFSECSANAMHYAAALAKHTESTLVLVHIIPMQVVAPTQVPVVLVESTEETRAFFNRKLDELAQHILTSTDFRLKVETLCMGGVFLEKMLKLIRSENPDLVVMGTRGANSILDNLIGTNTEALIHEAICPVLAVPENSHYHTISKIAFASNLKDREESFLRQLFRFANPLNTEVSIVNVKTGRHPKIGSDVKILEYITGLFPQDKYSLAQLKGENVIDGINIFLKENEVDILAIAIHEHGFFESLFHESISRELILHTTIPLLALHDRYDELLGAEEVENDYKTI